MPTLFQLPLLFTGLRVSVEYPTKISQLNDSYQQIVGGHKPTIIWNISTKPTLFATVQGWLDLLEQYQGVTEFFIDLGDIGLKLVRCLDYDFEYTLHEKGILRLTLIESESTDCPALEASLNISTIDSRLTESLNFLTRHINTNTFITLNPEKKLPPNACHTVLGRDGYFPPVCGTTEGIYITIIALMEIYFSTNNASALNLAQEMYNGAIDVVYKGNQPPNPPNSAIWLPHWLYAAKGSTITKGTATEPNFLNGGIYTDAVSFTNIGSRVWTRNVGSELSDVYLVYSSDGELLWKYIFSSLIAGVSYSLVYWIDKYNRKCSRVNNRIVYGTNDTGQTIGTIAVQLSNDVPSLSAKIIYTNYVPSILVNKNECLEAFPFWRRVLNDEYNHALDVSNWAYLAYEYLYTATNNAVYLRAMEATRLSTIEAMDIQNESFVFRIDLESGEPFSIAGTQLIKINGKTGSATRKPFAPLAGGLEVVHNASDPLTYGQLELQNFVVAAVWTRSTYISTQAIATQDVILFWGVSTRENAGDFSGMYYAPIKMVANTQLNKNIVASDFVRFGIKTIWHPTKADIPIYTYTGGGSVSYSLINTTITSQTGIVTSPLIIQISFTKGSFAGCGLNNPNDYGRKPPKLYYKLISGTVEYIVTDASNNKFVKQLTTTTDWTLANFAVTELTARNSGDVFNDQASILALEFEVVSSSAVLQIYYVGETPEPLPVPCYTYKTVVGNRSPNFMFWSVGDCEIINSTLNILPYTPGVIPFTYNRIGAAKVSWVGEAMTGYQSARMCQKWGLYNHERQVGLFWLAAQDSYTQDSPSGLIGVARQSYNWARFDAVAKPPYNRFVDVGSDPNIRWEGYQHRYIADCAEAWYYNQSNTVLGTVTMRFLRWIDAYWNLNGQPGRVPTDYIPPQDGLPQRNYTSPHGTALVLVCAIYANLAGGNRLITFRTIERCFTFLETQYISTGVMSGSWALDQPNFVDGGTTYKEYFPFWHSEIIRAYVALKKYKAQLRYPSCSDYGF